MFLPLPLRVVQTHTHTLSLNQLLLGQSSVRRVAWSLNHKVGDRPSSMRHSKRCFVHRYINSYTYACAHTLVHIRMCISLLINAGQCGSSKMLQGTLVLRVLSFTYPLLPSRTSSLTWTTPRQTAVVYSSRCQRHYTCIRDLVNITFPSPSTLCPLTLIMTTFARSLTLPIKDTDEWKTGNFFPFDEAV